MTQKELIKIITKATDSGLQIKDICRESGITTMQFWRIKNGFHSPRLITAEKIVKAIEKLKGG